MVRQERTPEPTALAARLYAETGGEVPGLEITRPSLEDIYLSMVATHGANKTVASATVTANPSEGEGA